MEQLSQAIDAFMGHHPVIHVLLGIFTGVLGAGHLKGWWSRVSGPTDQSGSDNFPGK